MHKVLEDIVRKKRADLEIAKQRLPLSDLKRQSQAIAYTSRFFATMQSSSRTALIAEIKLASPTHPNLGNRDVMLERAREYEAAGADANSFITEPHYFKGSLEDLAILKKTTNLPVLQKDFVIDDYQIYQARITGSDALLLIAKLLDAGTLKQFVALALYLGIEPVVEVNDQADLDKALETPARIIAVNARDLGTFKVDVVGACELIRSIPDTYVRLGFSGVSSAEQVAAYTNAGANGVLVGTSLMQAPDVRGYIAALRAGGKHGEG